MAQEIWRSAGRSGTCLKDLAQENAKLKRLGANLSLDNLVLKNLASGNFYALNDALLRWVMHVSAA